MRIKKVKVTKEKKISMVYEQQAKNGYTWDEYAFTCSEEPRPDFYRALKDLGQDVIVMCELPESYLDRITVKGVSFSYAEGVMGAVIIANMDLNKSYQGLNMITPHKACAMYNPDTPADDMQLLDSKCIERLELLQEEAEAYIKGDRAQGTLFPEANTDDGVQSAQLN